MSDDKNAASTAPAAPPLQPLSSLGPMPKPPAPKPDPDDPARLEYLEARRMLERGEYAQAAMGFHNVLRSFEERGDRVGVANAADRLGDACMGREEFAMAIANYERAYAICAEEADDASLLSLNRKMAECQRRLGQYDRALSHLDDMLEAYRLNRNPKGAVETLEAMSAVYAESGDRAAAAEALRTAAGIHRNFKHAAAAAELSRRAEEMERG